MKYTVFTLGIFCLLSFTNCASIPKQAPELSEELGLKIRLIQDSHLVLIDKYFEHKENEIDEYINKVWLPKFAENLFESAAIQQTWEKIVESPKDIDRVKFLTLVGPEIQKKINSKRSELVKPLYNLKSEVKTQISKEYNTAYSINNTITSFLYSASEVSENRSRYLEKLGITDEKIDSAIEETSKAVDNLIEAGGKVEEGETKIKEYLKKIEEIKANLKK